MARTGQERGNSMAITWQGRGKNMALTWQDRAVLSDIDTGGRRRERVVGAEERTVGAEEGRRAQDTAKTTPKQLQKIVIKKRRLRLFFMFPPMNG